MALSRTNKLKNSIYFLRVIEKKNLAFYGNSNLHLFELRMWVVRYLSCLFKKIFLPIRSHYIKTGWCDNGTHRFEIVWRLPTYLHTQVFIYIVTWKRCLNYLQAMFFFHHNKHFTFGSVCFYFFLNPLGKNWRMWRNCK